MLRVYEEMYSYLFSNDQSQRYHQKLINALVKKFSVPSEAFQYSNILEEKILEHIMSILEDKNAIIPPDIRVAEDAYYSISNKNLIVKYAVLNYGQLYQIAKAYNKKYGNICEVLHRIEYNNNICTQIVDGISFNIDLFITKILTNMDEQLSSQHRFFYQRNKSGDSIIVMPSSFLQINDSIFSQLSSIVYLIKEKYDVDAVGLYNPSHRNCVALVFRNLRLHDGEHPIYNHTKPIDFMSNIDASSISRFTSENDIREGTHGEMYFIFNPTYLSNMIAGLKIITAPIPEKLDEIREERVKTLRRMKS